MLLPQREAAHLITEILEHLPDWPIKTAEGFRNAVLAGSFAMNPLFKIEDEGKESMAMMFRDRIVATVNEGRMIDFGFIPNEVMKTEGQRSRELFESGEFEHPYEEWLAVSRWEGGCNGYLFMTSPDFPGCYCVELYGVDYPGLGPVILLYDLIALSVEDGTTKIGPAKFVVEQSDDDLTARGANSLDPLVTMLRILADASVVVVDHPAPERLNKARAKAGKYLIPAHAEVKTCDYVAAFRAHKEQKRVAGGGHHASPTAHWRRHHLRHLSSGKVVPVRASKINWREKEDLHRLFYRMVKGK